MDGAEGALRMTTFRRREREEIQRRLEAFDQALEDLRKAKERLQTAADLYLERLEGTKSAKRNG